MGEKNGPRDVDNNISWAVGKIFFFKFCFFITNICTIGVIMTSMTATAPRNTMGWMTMMDDHQCHCCHVTAAATTTIQDHPQGSPFWLTLELGFSRCFTYVLWYHFWLAYHHQLNLDFSIIVKNTFLLYLEKTVFLIWALSCKIIFLLCSYYTKKDSLLNLSFII